MLWIVPRNTDSSPNDAQRVGIVLHSAMSFSLGVAMKFPGCTEVFRLTKTEMCHRFDLASSQQHHWCVIISNGRSNATHVLSAGKKFFFHRAPLRGHDKPFIVPLIELWTYARSTHHRVFMMARPGTRVTLTNARKNHPFAPRSPPRVSCNGMLRATVCFCPLFFIRSPFSVRVPFETVACRTAMRAQRLDISMKGESREGWDTPLPLNARKEKFYPQSGSTRIAVNRRDNHPLQYA